MPKLPEPEISDNGIKIWLDAKYWVMFTKEWSNLDIRTFRRIKDDLLALRAVIDKVVDWNIPNGHWEPLPFDRTLLTGQIDAFVQGIAQEDMAAVLLQLKPQALRELNEYAKNHPELREQMETVIGAVLQASLLVEKAKAVLRESGDKCFTIPAQLQSKLIGAYVEAYTTACRLPFDSSFSSMLPPSSSASGSRDGSKETTAASLRN